MALMCPGEFGVSMSLVDPRLTRGWWSLVQGRLRCPGQEVRAIHGVKELSQKHTLDWVSSCQRDRDISEMSLEVAGISAFIL